MSDKIEIDIDSIIHRLTEVKNQKPGKLVMLADH